MNKELKLEIDRLREDIQSSDIVQVKPYINGKTNVSNPKGHLQTHVNTIENLLKPPTADEVCKALSEYYSKKHKEKFDIILADSQFIASGKNWSFYLTDQEIGSFMLDERYDLITMIGRFYEGKK